jgi:hypothetical protein
MNVSSENEQSQLSHKLVCYLLFPGVAMSLGWGLRGYIGGGPFGAMIPGALVTMAICLLIRSQPSWTALATVFGTVGVAFGGQMTYGQTIGHIVLPESFLWGFLGLSLKGCIWGLLGGAMIGLGFSHRQHQRRDIIIGFILLLLASYVGWRLINEPKLIYFSNPVDRPRGESWAGLLFGAIALVAYLEACAGRKAGKLPLKFMLWGGLAGLIGFGGGGLWMALSRQVPETLRWLPYWKFMEYSFGLCFGVGLGYCAYRNRTTLFRFGDTDQNDSSTQALSRFALQFVCAVAACLFVFYIWPGTLRGLFSFAPDASAQGITGEILRLIRRMLFGYTTMGLILVAACTVWRRFAWHIAITVTFCAAAWDFARDLVPDRGFDVSVPHQWYMVIAATLVVGCMVIYYEISQRSPVKPLFLLLTWSCMVVAYLRLLVLEMKILWLDSALVAEAGGFLPFIFGAHKGGLVVHGIFTLEAIAITWIVHRIVREA